MAKVCEVVQPVPGSDIFTVNVPTLFEPERFTLVDVEVKFGGLIIQL